MTSTYTRQFYTGGFKDLPLATTPISAAFLNALEAAILAAREPAQPRAGAPLLAKLLDGGTAGVVTLADSKMEGSGVNRTELRSQNRAAEALRILTGATGAGWDMGRGYIPAHYATFFGFEDAPVLSAGAVPINEGGLGGRSVSLEKPGGTVDFGALDFGTMTSFKVAFTRRPDTANMQVLIDDVPTIVNTNNPSLVYGGLATVALPSGGVHTVKVRQTGDYVARVEGIVHRTDDQGIVLYDGSRAGAQTTMYVPGTTNPDRIWQSMSTVCENVALVVAAFGANDMASITVAEWSSNLEAIIVKARTVWPGAAFLFVMAAERLEDADEPDSTKHADFTAAARHVLAQHPHTVFMSEADYWQPRAGATTAAEDGQGWLADTVHYGEAAGSLLGRGIAAAVMGPGPALNVL